LHEQGLKSIALVGMPGCGKSTVGRQLARALGWHLVDTDHAIEGRIGGSIRRFFETHGEAAFRDLEQEVLEEVTRTGQAVVATGGGTVLRPANREVLRSRCRVFYIRATPEELFRRLRHDTQRPLLQGGDPLKKLRDLFRERDSLYRRTAHFTIEAARPSVAGLLNMILMQLELAGMVDPAQVPSPVDARAPADGR
jgi:shikimate kinase